MNVFHKVLVKIFDLTGGKDNVEVDLADLLKKEGFFPSIDSISAQLLGESWITDGSRMYTCKITHWGVAEAKRVMSNAPDKVSEIDKESKRLLTEARGLITLLEEFASKPDSKKFDGIEKRISDLADRSKAVRQHL